MRPFVTLALLAASLLLAGCTHATNAPTPAPAGDAAAAPAASGTPMHSDESPAPTPSASGSELATFGAGCFWCVEAVLEQIRGVEDVVSGYMGGSVDEPTYEEVCTGRTGHAEVVQVRFDPSVISFADLVDLFWDLHDPTTLNRQGADRGTQYRSAIFFHSDEQRRLAEASRDAAQPRFEDPIVTEISAASTFWPAEGYHQDYYRGNKDSNPYCRAVITPKLKKLGLKY